MCKPRYWLLAVSLWLTIGSLSAETNSFIALGKYRAHPTRILAKYKNVDPKAIESTTSTLTSLGVAVKHRIDLVPGLVVLDTNPRVALQSVQALSDQAKAQSLVANIAALENSGLFEYVQPSYVYTNVLVPNDSAFADATLWGLRNTGTNGGVVGADIDAPDAWDVTTGTNSVIVAVIDSGIRYTHKDLASQMWHNPGENPTNGLDDDGNGFIDDVYGINTVANTGDPMDDIGHGTHVAGTIGAAANNDNPMVGVTWHVQLMACKFIDGVTGTGLSDDAIRCIDYAVKHGAKILNNSWSGGPFERALLDSITAAQKANVLFIVAAGNTADNNDITPVYPANYQVSNVISVGAMDRTDNIAFFSDYGATNVHVMAPGVEIFSTYNGSDSDYQVLQGTSMAAPHVSGVAALILSKYPKALLPELRQRIISTAVKVPAFRGLCVSEGRVNAYRALTASADGILEMSVYPPPGNDLLVGSVVTLLVTVTDLQPVTNATVVANYLTNNIGGTNVLNFLNDGKAPDTVASNEVYTANLIVPNLTNDLVLNFVITAPGKTGITNSVSYHLAQHPANDNFENATKIVSGGGLVLGTNRFATIQLNEPKHANIPSVDASVWWNWSPAANGKVIVDTAGSSFDTVLAVYTNNTLRALSEVASVDDVGVNNLRKQGYVLFDAVAGLTYHIAVAGHTSADVGTIRLRVEPGGAPDTTPPTVTIVNPVSGSVITNADPHVVVTGVAADPTPNASGVKEVFVRVNSGLGTTIFGTTNWASTNLLTVGDNTLQFSAADFAGNRSVVKTMTLRYVPVILANDLFVNALPLTGTIGKVTASSTNATKEVGEPFHAGNEGGKSLWWYFLAPADGILSVNTSNSDFDTLLAIYTGSRVNSLTLVGSNDDATPGSGFSLLKQAVTANTLYRIAVDGYGGSSGHVVLNFNFAASTVSHIVVQTPDGGTVTPGSGLYAANVNLVFTATPGPNQEFDHWEGSTNSIVNPLTIQVSGDYQLIARFRTHQPSEGFETGNLSGLPWVSAGNAPWTVQTSVVANGKYAARSGTIKDGQISSLILSNIVLVAGTASFDFKVSSEPNWDFLEFYLNGKRLDRWSGEVGWLTFTFTVPAGQNTLEWRYTKDPINGSVGSDAGFMDNLELPKPAAGTTANTTVQVERIADGQVKVTVFGPADITYAVEVSDDLVHWETLTRAATVTTGTSFIDTTDTRATRFYRVVAP